ncbi:hypothetical protein CCYA_CCYA07G2180 [Cyanidiococcus yangmingshanensis]|nr:hypothetical protein CCYA_CCYA07G2180 [Cyanidiococcus yangmingshanensis]
MQRKDEQSCDKFCNTDTNPELHLIIFTKVPVLGCTKRRLGAQIGTELATQISAVLIEHTLAIANEWLQRLEANSTPVSVHLYYSPIGSESERAADADSWLDTNLRKRYPAFRVVPQSQAKRAEQDEDRRDPLGVRLIQAFREVTSSLGPQRNALVMVIGSDCPLLDANRLERAFALLKAGHQAVIGPAADGGYYLLGLQFKRSDRCDWMRMIQAAFGPHLVFSQGNVCQRTLDALQAAGVMTVRLSETLWDIDTAEDLTHLPAYLRPAGCPLPCSAEKMVSGQNSRDFHPETSSSESRNGSGTCEHGQTAGVRGDSSDAASR